MNTTLFTEALEESIHNTKQFIQLIRVRKKSLTAAIKKEEGRHTKD